MSGNGSKKEEGVVRRIDELGRITIPMEIRRNYNLGERSPLHIYSKNGKIIMIKQDAAREEKERTIEFVTLIKEHLGTDLSTAILEKLNKLPLDTLEHLIKEDMKQ